MYLYPWIVLSFEAFDITPDMLLIVFNPLLTVSCKVCAKHDSLFRAILSKAHQSFRHPHCSNYYEKKFPIHLLHSLH